MCVDGSIAARLRAIAGWVGATIAILIVLHVVFTPGAIARPHLADTPTLIAGPAVIMPSQPFATPAPMLTPAVSAVARPLPTRP